MNNGAEFPPLSGNKPKQLVIFLHGLGADGNDLISLAPSIAQNLPDTHFISPNAPFRCDMAPFGYQWFSFQDRDEHSILEGIKIAAPILNQYINEQLKRFNLEDKNVALVGFSQGTMMALYVALRREKPLAAIIGFSGAIIGDKFLDKEIKSRPPIFLAHGDQDEVVPYGTLLHAVKTLNDYAVPVKHHTCRNLGHSIDSDGIKLAVEFLVQSFK